MTMKRDSNLITMLFGKAQQSKMLMIINAITLLMILAIHSVAYAQSEATGNVNVLLGQRNMNEGDWKPVHEQTLLAVEADFGRKNWPVNMLVGFAGSKKDGNIVVTDGYNVAAVNLKGTTSEFYVGARKYFGAGTSFTPYLNGGVSFINAKAEASVAGFSVSGDDSSTGLFLGGGGIFRAGSFNIGLDLRLLTGTDIKIGSTSATADYSQFALILGYGW